MKKYLISAALCAMMFGTGCQNEEIVKQNASDEFTLTLDMGAKGRTMMGENGAVWGDNEALYVVGDGGKSYGTLTMVWKSADGKSAMFSGKITGDASKLEHMVYPVPNEDNQIPMNTLNGANHNAPMVGSIEGGEVTDLGYVGGLVKVKVNGEIGDKVVTLKAVEGENADDGTSVVAGYYQFNPESGTLEYKLYKEGEGENKTVTVTNIPENGIIYLPVDTDATKENAETITVSLTIGDGEPVVAQVKVAENGATESGENSFPVVNYDEEVGVVSSKIYDSTELKQAASVGGEYELMTNINTDEIIKISEEIKIEGNGNSVTSTAKYVFEVIGEEIGVAMNKLHIVNNAGKAVVDSEYLAGIKIDPGLKGVGLALNSCSVEFNNGDNGNDWAYAVNVAGSTSNCGINIIGGNYEGANVINVWGTGHGIDINGATLTSLYQPNEVYCGVCIKLEENGNHVEKNNNEYYGNNAVDFWWPGGDISISGGNDKNYTKRVVAKVKDEWCYSLEEAAKKEGQIYLFGDVTLNSDININGSIIVDAGRQATVELNGFDITAPTSDVFEVLGTLTINGNDESVVYAGSDENNTNSVCAVWAHGGTVTINGGYYKVGHDKDGNGGNQNHRNDCIYAGYNETKEGGIIEINDGKFEYVGTESVADGNKFLLNCADNAEQHTAKITVNGGWFKNHVPGYEEVTPAGREDKEVVLGEGKNVYCDEKEITESHVTNEDKWYEVR